MACRGMRGARLNAEAHRKVVPGSTSRSGAAELERFRCTRSCRRRRDPVQLHQRITTLLQRAAVHSADVVGLCALPLGPAQRAADIEAVHVRVLSKLQPAWAAREENDRPLRDESACLLAR